MNRSKWLIFWAYRTFAQGAVSLLIGEEYAGDTPDVDQETLVAQTVSKLSGGTVVE